MALRPSIAECLQQAMAFELGRSIKVSNYKVLKWDFRYIRVYIINSIIIFPKIWEIFPLRLPLRVKRKS